MKCRQRAGQKFDGIAACDTHDDFALPPNLINRPKPFNAGLRGFFPESGSFPRIAFQPASPRPAKKSVFHPGFLCG
jgi:hypothetical protein